MDVNRIIVFGGETCDHVKFEKENKRKEAKPIQICGRLQQVFLAIEEDPL